MALINWSARFIPKNLSNYTKSILGGSNNMMIPGPTPVNDCFLTDQRTFDSVPTASSLTRSLVKIDPANLYMLSQNHHCDNTVEVHCEDGEVECYKAPDASRLKVEALSVGGNTLSFTFTGGAGNPCVGAVAPDIHWIVHVLVEKHGGNATQVTVRLGSKVEPFPAFEIYASLGVTKTLFNRSPDGGVTPWNLYGLPNKAVTGSLNQN